MIFAKFKETNLKIVIILIILKNMQFVYSIVKKNDKSRKCWKHFMQIFEFYYGLIFAMKLGNFVKMYYIQWNICTYVICVKKYTKMKKFEPI